MEGVNKMPQENRQKGHESAPENELERMASRPATRAQNVAGTIKILAIVAAAMALLWVLDYWVT
jgi:hypothetical protein